MSEQTMRVVFAFDFDGTLADTRALFESCFEAAAARHGCSERLPRREFLRLFDGNLIEAMIARGLSEAECGALMATLGDLLAEREAEMRLFPGVREMILGLAARHPVLVITSNVSAVVESVMRREGLASVIGGVWGADVEPSKVRKLGNAQARWPGHVLVYVGDTLGDMLEARRAGAVPVAVGWGWHSPTHIRQADPAAIVDHPGDVTRTDWLSGPPYSRAGGPPPYRHRPCAGG
jgi:phosphoglycolate phosphatase